MNNVSLTIPEKIYISCKETFKDPSRAGTLGAFVTAAVLSSPFRIGLFLSPLGFVSTLAASWIGRRILPSELPPLPSRIQKIFEGSAHFLQKIPSTSEEFDSVILYPILEEVVFRGILQPPLIRKVGTIAGIILSSIAFALPHYDPREPSYIFNAFVGGVALGTLSKKISFFASLGYHVGINAFWYLGFHLCRNYSEAEYLKNRNSTDPFS